jgi:hypothetical protein
MPSRVISKGNGYSRQPAGSTPSAYLHFLYLAYFTQLLQWESEKKSALEASKRRR